MRQNRGFLRFICSMLVIALVWGCANSNLNTPNLSSPVNNTGSFNTKNYPCDNTYANATAIYYANFTSPFGPGVTNSGYTMGLYLRGNSNQTQIDYTLSITWGTGNWPASASTSGIITGQTPLGPMNIRTLSERDTFTIDLPNNGSFVGGSLTFTMGSTSIEVAGTFKMGYEYAPYYVTFENATASIPLDNSCVTPSPTPTPTTTVVPTPLPTPIPTPIPTPGGGGSTPSPVPTPSGGDCSSASSGFSIKSLNNEEIGQAIADIDQIINDIDNTILQLDSSQKGFKIKGIDDVKKDLKEKLKQLKEKLQAVKKEVQTGKLIKDSFKSALKELKDYYNSTKDFLNQVTDGTAAIAQQKLDELEKQINDLSCSVIGRGDSNSNRTGVSREDILVGAVPFNTDKKSPKYEQYIKDGGIPQGNKDFEAFVGNKGEIKTGDRGKLRFAELKDHPTEPAGTKVNFREFSNEGHPTLEIKYPNGSGKPNTKIRYRN